MDNAVDVSPSKLDSNWEATRAQCQGIPPIDARWSVWMQECCSGATLHELVEQYGSPLNVHCVAPFERNIQDLYRVADEAGIAFDVYFARKANKCIAYVDAARQIGCGVDVASLDELRQALAAGIPAERIVTTAAVKSTELLTECVAAGVVVVLDNLDEINRTAALAGPTTPAKVALRVSRFWRQGTKLESRFGLDVDKVESLIAGAGSLAPGGRLCIVGLHFHLDGYSAEERIAAIQQSVDLAEVVRSAGHPVAFLDAGGGMPMAYVEGPQQLEAFWQRLEQSLLGNAPPITWNNHGLGRFAIDNVVHGRRETYPYYQNPTQAEWLQSILEADAGGQPLAELLRRAQLQLRCEPGRAVLDQCGLTAARVEFRKPTSDGSWLIGLSMNHTQCRTGSVDFLVDPILVRDARASDPTESIEAYLVGAYCTETEFLTLRRFAFPAGVALGDLIVFPNTAGYLMHFRESRSHQLPLAKNVIWQGDAAGQYVLDAIDR